MIKPFYQRGGVTIYHADARELEDQLCASLPATRRHVIMDTPYSNRMHSVARVYAGGGMDGANRTTELGFGCLTPALMRGLARMAAKLADRWTLVFSDIDIAHQWRDVLKAAGLDIKRTGAWIKLGATPKLNADGPAEGFEPITVAHRRLTEEEDRETSEEIAYLRARLADLEALKSGGLESITIGHRGLTRREGREWQKHRFWNSGGKIGVWQYPIVHGTKDDPRMHTTPKPPKLMLELINDFTLPGETVYDLTCGDATTGVAALRGAGGPRDFVGIDIDRATCERAAVRLDAELNTSTVGATHRGQTSLFGGRS